MENLEEVPEGEACSFSVRMVFLMVRREAAARKLQIFDAARS
ncbi:MAG: hypothetical protein P0107_04170 [Nitrosomonas sp.]|nr:hypothetical protein [Nitrosomonas sp.]